MRPLLGRSRYIRVAGFLCALGAFATLAFVLESAQRGPAGEPAPDERIGPAATTLSASFLPAPASGWGSAAAGGLLLGTLVLLIPAVATRRRAEVWAEVARRDVILEAVGVTAERLLRSERWEDGVREALTRLGHAADATRAYLFEVREMDGDLLAQRRAAWIADGVDHPLEECLGLVESGFGRWAQRFRGGETIHLPVEALPEGEREIVRRYGIKAILAIPIFVDDRWWGILAMDDCRRGRAWSDVEVEALRTAGSIIGAAIARASRDKEIHESEERFRQVADNLSEVIWLTSVDLNELLYVNPAFERVWGRTVEEFRGNPMLCLDTIHPEDLSRLLDDAERAGERVIPPVAEYRIIRPDGSIRWIRSSTILVRDEAGEPYRIGGCSLDITEAKQMVEEIRRSSRLEAIGSLSAGLAHEINNPVQYVGGNLRFLMDSLEDLAAVLDVYQRVVTAAEGGSLTPHLLGEAHEAAARADLDYILSEAPVAGQQAIEGVTKIGEIIRALREFSHSTPSRKTPVDLNRVIESTVSLSRHEWKYVAAVDLDLDPALEDVPCVPGEMNQVLLHLIVNAAHAIADARTDPEASPGSITISTRGRDGWAELRVSDSGTGIPDHVLPRMYDPFFTTKDVGRGTGQGLTLVHAIVVEHHGGTISVETAAGVGTSFTIRLPTGEG